MDDKELVIKISGDLKDYKSALNMAEEETEGLSDALGSIAKVSGIAFAALTAEIFLSVRALNVEADALEKVNNALQNQGIYSDELAASYRRTAEAIEKKTGVDADAISSSQATIQGLIGQTQITDGLTRAVVDFSKAQKIDLEGAFNIVGKAIQGNVGALGRYGISIEDNLSKNERLQRITEVLGQKFGGAAEKSANAAGSLDKFTAQIGNAQKEIGRRFQPAFDKALDTITGFIEVFNENKAVADFTVACIAAGVAVSGVALVASVAGIGFLKLKAAMLAAQIATGAMTVATRALVGATGLGLLVIILAEIYLNWSTIWPRMQVIYQAFVNNIIDIAKGLGKILYAVFVPSASSLQDIQDGAKQVAEALKKGYGEATQSLEQYGPNPAAAQDETKKGLADAAAQKERDADRRRRETRQAELELSRLQEEKASLETIDLKKQEIEILKALEDDKNAFMRSSLEQRLAETKAREAEQLAVDQERRAVLNEELLANNEAFQQLTEEQQRDFLARNQQQIEQGILTSKTVKQEAVKQELEIQKAANNQYLLEQQKFGTGYATINKAMHSSVYQGTKTAFGELAELQQSSNNTLKSIGKAAAIANIAIKTAESAMNVYAGFSTIPIVGPALGIAAAGAVIAFGAERISQVNAAADGALVQGGVRGKDSVPFMLEPGELVVPKRNFEEVVGSTAAQRAGQSLGGGQSNGEIIGAIDNLTEAVLSMPRGGVTVQGDFLADQIFIDRILKGISDTLESGNGKLYGVNT